MRRSACHEVICISCICQARQKISGSAASELQLGPKRGRHHAAQRYEYSYHLLVPVPGTQYLIHVHE